jgi:hypothetical protein
MSSTKRWQTPNVGPATGKVRNDRAALLLPDFETGVARYAPAPSLEAEIEVWSKPTGTIAFPIHTGAVVELYKRAWDELEESDVLSGLSVEGRAWVERECWRVTGLVFRPGIAVRAALDAAAQSRSLLPVRPSIEVPFDTMRAAQLSYVATWAVFTAACKWAAQ